jgi:hypothetical protein
MYTMLIIIIYLSHIGTSTIVGFDDYRWCSHQAERISKNIRKDISRAYAYCIQTKTDKISYEGEDI